MIASFNFSLQTSFMHTMRLSLEPPTFAASLERKASPDVEDSFPFFFFFSSYLPLVYGPLFFVVTVTTV
jgi:hypothetical protein